MNAVEAQLHPLMIATLAGNAVAYTALLSVLDGHLRAYFRRRLHADPDRAEDLVQETLLAVHNQRHTFEPSEPFTPWVHAIAKYKLIDLLRRDTRLREEALADDEQALWDDSSLEASSARRDLGVLLAALPPRFELPIRHVKLEGRSVEETAALTGMSSSAVKIGIHRGLKLLARTLLKTRDADA